MSLVIDDTYTIKQQPYRWVAKLNKVVGAQSINLQVSQLNISKNKLAAFINEMIAAEKEGRQYIINKYFRS